MNKSNYNVILILSPFLLVGLSFGLGTAYWRWYASNHVDLADTSYARIGNPDTADKLNELYNYLLSRGLLDKDTNIHVAQPYQPQDYQSILRHLYQQHFFHQPITFEYQKTHIDDEKTHRGWLALQSMVDMVQELLKHGDFPAEIPPHQVISALTIWDLTHSHDKRDETARKLTQTIVRLNNELLPPPVPKEK